jgi:hypothetical protein
MGSWERGCIAPFSIIMSLKRLVRAAQGRLTALKPTLDFILAFRNNFLARPECLVQGGFFGCLVDGNEGCVPPAVLLPVGCERAAPSLLRDEGGGIPPRLLVPLVHLHR